MTALVVQWTGVMFDVPLLFAFAAGMASLLNPCGAAMLPAYIGYQIGAGPTIGNPIYAVARGVHLGLLTTAGFVTLCGAIGLGIAAGGRILIDLMPAAGLIVGISMVLMSLWLLMTGRHVGIMAASRVTRPGGMGARSLFLFGVAYGTASLSCTLPIFLVVVFSTFAASGFVAAFLGFLFYGLGMGSMLLLVTIAVVLSKSFTVRTLRAASPYLGWVGSLMLLAAGIYIIHYWALGTGSQLLFQ